MKIKLVAAAVLALCSSASFAATVLACKTDTAVNMVNTCAPEASLYVAGSSALGGALGVVVPADLFDQSVTPLIKIKDTASSNGSAGAVTAWYGMSKAALTGGTSKRLFVVYNKQNGSAAGVSQLLSTPKDLTIPENDVVTVGAVKNVAGNCTADAASTTAVPVLSCTSHAPSQADMAISDVAPIELYKLEGVKPAALTTVKSTPLALQGFGVAVNANLYAALQTAQNTTGVPSIRRADYASLISKEGTIKSAAGLIPGSTETLTLARRDDLSGTQASSNMFFADNACGVNVDAKGKLIAGHLGGALALIDSTMAATYPNVVIQSNVTGGGVTTALSATTGYAIGVISLTTSQPSSGWKFVAIDGAAPLVAGDVKQRLAFANGDYGFAMTAFAVTPVKQAAGKSALTDAITTGLKDSTLHDLTGIAYLDGAANTKQSLVHRTNGNNCSPLIK